MPNQATVSEIPYVTREEFSRLLKWMMGIGVTITLAAVAGAWGLFTWQVDSLRDDHTGFVNVREFDSLQTDVREIKQEQRSQNRIMSEILQEVRSR